VKIQIHKGRQLKTGGSVLTPHCITSDYPSVQLARTLCGKFNVHGSVHRNNIPIYIQQVATLHSLFYQETALHVSGGTITHNQERKQLYLQHLVFVRLLLLPAAIAEDLQPV